MINAKKKIQQQQNERNAEHAKNSLDDFSVVPKRSSSAATRLFLYASIPINKQAINQPNSTNLVLFLLVVGVVVVLISERRKQVRLARHLGHETFSMLNFSRSSETGGMPSKVSIALPADSASPFYTVAYNWMDSYFRLYSLFR